MSFVILLIMFGYCIELLSKYDTKNPTTLSFLIVGITLFLLATYLLVLFLKVFKITFYSNRIELVQFFGLNRRSIVLTQIDSWVIRKNKSKYGDYEILYIVLSDKSHLKLSSYLYTNFDFIKRKLKNNKPQNRFLREQLDRKEQTQFTFFFIAIGCVFIWYAVDAYQDKQITRTDISIVKGHLLENIEIKKSRRSRTLIIKLKEYPEYEFKIGSLFLRETASGYLRDTYKKGDELKFAIETTDYEKKIAKTQSLSSWDYIFHYHSIAIVEVTEDDFDYLSLENYNKANNSNTLGIMLFFGAFGVSFTAFGFVRLRKKLLKPLSANSRLRKTIN
ncbi:hypothetical protein [Flavobacterium sp. SM2513]|uniref:hypothetical protein n=1 Tax=Flavobacterium sp. SM2513 TaxID=3424766 RepID=UPI003D7FE729